MQLVLGFAGYVLSRFLVVAHSLDLLYARFISVADMIIHNSRREGLQSGLARPYSCMPRHLRSQVLGTIAVHITRRAFPFSQVLRE